MPAPPAGAIVLRTPAPGGFGPVAAMTRAAAAVAAELSEVIEPGRLEGAAMAHAREAVGIAAQTLDQIAARGWPAVVGHGMTAALDGAGWIGRGPASVAASQARFDPLADLLADVPARGA
jgi:hypothetical protein